ncbi:hypothetical protein BUZ94_03845 [Mammaliicoccus sciuri]|uniref:hypothetical protein n=1 Tax=Mammaliicoccus sciuri TaxID=1296 RepID=UPI000E67BD72|nr:hypothetical protein [Mammaliicoccus sciuri]RIO10856.1 hypothetical protein BUZ94_03845 [Mammaliicoccus sciuri]
MYKSNLLNTVLLGFISISSIIVTIYIFINRNELKSGYEYFYLLPLFYCISYLLFLNNINNKYGLSVFMAVYLTVSFFRYVVLSYLVVSSGWYLGRSPISPSEKSFHHAIFLMIYELLVYNIFIYIFHKILFKKKMASNRKINFSNYEFIYITFIICTLVLICFYPDSLKFFSFFRVNNNYMSIESLNILPAITVICISISKLLIYFIIVKFIINNFDEKYKPISIILLVLITILNSLIFFGTNRSDFIFNFIINILILVYLYKKVGVYLSLMLMTLLPIVINKITEYRNSVTITGGVSKIIDFTDTLQIYLAGVYNVAISLDINSDKHGPFMLLIDIFRSAIGPNVFIKNLDILSSSKLFNERIFLNDHVSQIIPMIGQSYLYLGYILSPLLGIVFIYIAIYLTKQLIYVKRLELIYVFSLFSGRIGFVMAQNGNILLNDLTFYLPLFLLIYFINNKVVINYEKI